MAALHYVGPSPTVCNLGSKFAHSETHCNCPQSTIHLRRACSLAPKKYGRTSSGTSPAKINLMKFWRVSKWCGWDSARLVLDKLRCQAVWTSRWTRLELVQCSNWLFNTTAEWGGMWWWGLTTVCWHGRVLEKIIWTWTYQVKRK